MRHPGRWWLGLAVLALAWIMVNSLEDSRVERDIRKRATLAIEQDARVEGATARVAGRDVMLVGVSASSKNTEALVAKVATLRGVRQVRSSFTPPVAVHPFVLSIERKGGGIVLTGDVPSRQVRAKIAAEAARTGERVVDRLVYADGAPKGDLSLVVAAATAALAKLNEGAVTIHDAQVTASADAPPRRRPAGGGSGAP